MSYIQAGYHTLSGFTFATGGCRGLKKRLRLPILSVRPSVPSSFDISSNLRFVFLGSPIGRLASFIWSTIIAQMYGLLARCHMEINRDQINNKEKLPSNNGKKKVTKCSYAHSF